MYDFQCIASVVIHFRNNKLCKRVFWGYFCNFQALLSTFKSIPNHLGWGRLPYPPISHCPRWEYNLIEYNWICKQTKIIQIKSCWLYVKIKSRTLNYPTSTLGPPPILALKKMLFEPFLNSGSHEYIGEGHWSAWFLQKLPSCYNVKISLLGLKASLIKVNLCH